MGQPAETDFQQARRSFEAVRAQTRALRHRASALGRDLREARAALVGAVEVSRRTLSAIKAARGGTADAVVPAHASSPQDAFLQDAFLQALAASGLDAEGDLDNLTSDLIAAYRDAAAQDDDQLVALLGGALHEIGRYIATRTGPKAAGLRLS